MLWELIKSWVSRESKPLCSETNAITVKSLMSGFDSALLIGAKFQEGKSIAYP